MRDTVCRRDETDASYFLTDPFEASLTLILALILILTLTLIGYFLTDPFEVSHNLVPPSPRSVPPPCR